MSELSEAIEFAELVGPLPRCPHGQALRDASGEALEPPCGCRATSPDRQVETLEEIAERIADFSLVAFHDNQSATRRQIAADILSALRNERERALRDAARLECVFCAGAAGFNPLPVEAAAENYVHRNDPPHGLAGVYCKAPRINDLARKVTNAK